MFRPQFIVSLVISIFLFQSCYVSKSLDREVNISLDESFVITISNTGNSTFSSNYLESDYRKAFLEGMKAELASGKILVVDNNPEFLVSISELRINESTKMEVVSDTDSPDNGKGFELTSLSLSAKGLVDKLDAERISNWNASKSKDEKVTNSRSGGQMISGSNKNNKTYREKSFDSNITLDLARKCGRRSGARIINDIVKALK